MVGEQTCLLHSCLVRERGVGRRFKGWEKRCTTNDDNKDAGGGRHGYDGAHSNNSGFIFS